MSSAEGNAYIRAWALSAVAGGMTPDAAVAEARAKWAERVENAKIIDNLLKEDK